MSPWQRPRRVRTLSLLGLALALVASVPVLAQVAGGDPSDPARNLALPCELVNNPAFGATSRSKNKIEHLANRCGIVGTDIEFQSRKDSRNRTRDYAFVGTMGYGFQIFDVTNPANPQEAGGGGVSGWQNDIQVRGNVAVSTFDGVSGEGSTTSTCLKTKFNPTTANDQGIDIFTLNFNSATAKFTVSQTTCVANPPGGTHNATIHPSGKWIALSNCCSDWAMDVVDLTKRRADNGTPPVTYRFIDASRSQSGRCPPPDQPQLKCVVVTGPGGASASGLWQPHDISFSHDGNTAYVAAIKSTFIVDVSRARSGQLRTIAIIPNQDPNATSPDHNIVTSHQADVTPDGRLLLVTDEKGGGLSNTQCNTTPNGEIGGIHFFALARLSGVPKSNGASPSNPKKLGTWIYPNPLLGADTLPRTERACTVHVFRIGGNGTAGPGAIASGFDGVSRLSQRQLVTGHYGAGTWWVDFSGPSNRNDGNAEDIDSTWGNTLGWNIMPGAETWSSKEYKGYIYTGDMARGLDVFAFKK